MLTSRSHARRPGHEEVEHERPALGQQAHVQRARIVARERARRTQIRVAVQGQTRPAAPRSSEAADPPATPGVPDPDVVSGQRVDQEADHEHGREHADHPRVAAIVDEGSGTESGARSRHACPPPPRQSRRRPARAALADAPQRVRAARTARAPTGSTSSTPPSDTVRSTSVTSPKSRSIVMLDKREHPEPGDRGDPRREHRRAGEPVRPRQRLGPGERPPRRSCAEALGQQHAELGRDRDHERAERGRHRVERDPRSRTGSATTTRSRARSARAGRAPAATVRRTASSTSPTAISPASSISIRRPDEDSDASACAASTGRPASAALTPGRRMQVRSHVVDHALLARQRHQPNPERERRLAVIGRDHRLGEVRRHRLAAGSRSGRWSASWRTSRSSPGCPSRTGRAATAPGTASPRAHPFAST